MRRSFKGLDHTSTQRAVRFGAGMNLGVNAVFVVDAVGI
jgi:hypothetical protein